MKRTAGAFMLLASLGGCMQADRNKPNYFNQAKAAQTKKAPSYQGPYGEPINAGNKPTTGMSPGMAQVGYTAGSNPRPGADLIQAGYLRSGEGEVVNAGHASIDDSRSVGLGYGPKHGEPHAPPFYHKNEGIVPVPAQGPPGAVAAIGALPAQMPMQPMNMRTSVNFASPDGMRVTWYGPSGWSDQPLITPARYNFLQGGVYRLRMSSVPNRLEKVYYPTLEVVPAQDTTATYLAHSSVPVTFTDEDFEQVDSGNFLVKVVYLPNPQNQDLATVVGPNELVSTRLEPGIDPIVEAQRRGTILLIARMGNIDLNAPNSPAMDAPSPHMMQRMGPPPGPDATLPVPEKTESTPEMKDVKPMPIPLPKSAMPEEKKTEAAAPILIRPSMLPVLQ